MKRFKHYILPLLLLLLSVWVALPVEAQRRARIFGQVKDDTGAPIELATVRVASQNVMTLTNLRGEYSLWVETADSVRVIYSMIGYETRRRLLRQPVDSVRLDVVLPL